MHVIARGVCLESACFNMSSDWKQNNRISVEETMHRIRTK